MIENIRQAIPIAIECVEKNMQCKVKNIEPKNEGRHFFLTTDNGLKYWLLFKRKFFMSFGKIFNMAGIGESVNKEWVTTAINQHNINAFLFVYENGYVYTVPPTELKAFAEENNTIRQTVSGETTYSVPITSLRRWR